MNKRLIIIGILAIVSFALGVAGCSNDKESSQISATKFIEDAFSGNKDKLTSCPFAHKESLKESEMYNEIVNHHDRFFAEMKKAGAAGEFSVDCKRDKDSADKATFYCRLSFGVQRMPSLFIECTKLDGKWLVTKLDLAERTSLYEVLGKGKNLVMAINQGSIERKLSGLAPLWPKASGSSDFSGKSDDDIAKKTFATSTEYFKVLLDLEHDGANEYVCGVDGNNLRLTGNGESCDWLILANMTEEVSDNVPVLISANFPPDALTFPPDSSKDNQPIVVGTKVGRGKLVWADDYVVAIYRDGACRLFGADSLTQSKLFLRSRVVVPNNITLRYLDVE